MVLTSIDIQQQKFRKAFSGYNRQEVDNFLEILANDMGIMSQKYIELENSIKCTEQELNEYRDRDTSMKEAMLTAQKAIDEIREQANKEAQLIITEAEIRSERLVYESHKRVGSITHDIQDLKRQRMQTIEDLKNILKAHQKLIEFYEKEEEKKISTKEASVTLLKDVLLKPNPMEKNVENIHLKKSSLNEG